MTASGCWTPSTPTRSSAARPAPPPAWTTPTRAPSCATRSPPAAPPTSTPPWRGSARSPARCARFTATTQTGIQEDVQVGDAPLPKVGDRSQGLRISLSATDRDDRHAVLTLEVAAVRAGQDAFALTNGGLGDVPNDATQAAVQVGALRLADVRKQGRAQV